MDLGLPFDCLHKAIASAIHSDLPEITYEDRDWDAWKKLSKEDQTQAIKDHTVPKITKTRRIHEHEIEVRMFPQTWGSTALGYGGIGGAAMTSAYTIIVTYGNYYCVYFGGGRLAYMIDLYKSSDEGRHKFFEDISGENMADIYSKGKYL